MRLTQAELKEINDTREELQLAHAVLRDTDNKAQALQRSGSDQRKVVKKLETKLFELVAVAEESAPSDS